MAAPGRIEEGLPEPLGAAADAGGVNFAVWSAHATAIEVCLFEADGGETRLSLPGRTGPVFHGRIPGLAPGARYGLRAHGRFAPHEGLRFDPAKLLIDPYALALDSSVPLDPSMSAFGADSAATVPKAIVQAASDRSPRPRLATPWDRTVIYELHVRGFTRLHPDIPEPIRGTFAALAHPAVIAHLKSLGVTAVELLPCAAWIDERHLPPLGLSNYWGYNPIALMAPDPRLAPGGWPEVRAATDALAAAGIETILDVVFNHTGESDEHGPTVSLRGLDNASYYRLQPGAPQAYVNDAGTGNVLALDRPAPLRLALDALRAWAKLGGIEGFRFDLATTLARRDDGFDPAAPFLGAVGQDPELRELKLIAEPWDCGLGGYQLGRFPPPWAEWNDRFRDTARRFWRGDGVSLGELAARLAGSQDVFAARRPSRSLNFVTAHDGFTLADLVAFETKRNQANGEDNRDGSTHEWAWNNGVEGQTDDPSILATRKADQRALLATLLLSRGTPMIAMGAETAGSQGGNNNAYAQDNEIGWLDWTGADHDLAAFVARLAAARRDHPALRQDRFLDGRMLEAFPYPDIVWRRADGADMSAADWDAPDTPTLVAVLAAAEAGLDRVVVAIHRGHEGVEVQLPRAREGHAWTILIDSADPVRTGEAENVATLKPRSILLLAEAASPDGSPRGVDDAVLARLAKAAGIATEWRGFDGQPHAVGPDTQRALLASMDFAADSTRQALESLDALAAAHHRPLPFALSAEADAPFEIPLRIARGQPDPRTWLVLQGDDAEPLRVAAHEGRREVVVAPDGREVTLLWVAAGPAPAGRYLVTREDRPEASCRLTLAPQRCHLPPLLTGGGKAVGLATQLYALRRAGDQGVGDFTTLAMLMAAAREESVSVLAINPLHALFAGARDKASPYYPSDRRFLDPIYLDLAAVRGAGPIPSAAQSLAAMPAIDYPAVWALKRAALEQAFAAEDPPELAGFIAAGGQELHRFAIFEALAETQGAVPWRDWPADLQSPGARGVGAFAQQNAGRVRFHQYLQWLCEEQLAAAASGGPAIGLARDLAVAAAPDGAEAWAWSDLLASGVSIGAPPDAFAPQGQVWGAPPFNPQRLRADGHVRYGALLAANMRHAGALRVDHALGLARQFWVPAGAEGSDGAYVDFPLQDLLAQLTLESARARCLVIGEDLGVVPNGLRAALTARNILGYRVLPFERDETAFVRPADYAPMSWACPGTHDLPPLAGWWRGVEIDEREALGLTAAEAAAAEREDRAGDRDALVAALRGESLWPADGATPPEMTDDLAAAIHAFVARTASLIAVAQTDDLAGEQIGVNLPGTDQERANWRRRCSVAVEDLFRSPRAIAILSALRQVRP